MSVINRPIPSHLDKEKVKNMRVVLQIPERENELTPIVSLEALIEKLLRV